MKLIYTILPLLHLTNSAAIQPAVLSTRELSFSLADSVLQSAANAAFSESEVVFPAGTIAERQEVVTPDYLYTVMCVDAGFRGDCVVFGAAPGKCVNFFDFDTNVTLSATYDNAVSSLSTNTGGVCQFYKNTTCNSLGDDLGVTASYLYNLAVATSEYSADYDDQISSWRC